VLQAQPPPLAAGEEEEEIYLPSESHIKLNQIDAKGGLPEEQTLINPGRPYNLTVVLHGSNHQKTKKCRNSYTVQSNKIRIYTTSKNI